MKNINGIQNHWLIAAMATYIFGNIGLFFIIGHYFTIDLVFLIPWLFTIVLIVEIVMCFKAKLLKETFKYHHITKALLIICFLTWLGIIYVYLKNVFPSVF
ncbi:MAG: hypothetical protein NTV06_01850 [candidate division Zixibacteria bacterium]|nr:hypothetical protein [candidate division Zixibacteria bacterium]